MGRRTRWEDWRNRSPKALGDMSGVVLSRIGSPSAVGVQNFDYELPAKINICNDLAWTCINLVSSTAALGKQKARIKEGKEIKYVPDHPVQKLLDFPNASMTQFDLIQAYVTHQLLFGTVAMLLLREEMLEKCPICIDEGHDDCIHKLVYYNQGPIAQIMPIHPANLEQNYVEVDGRRKKFFFYVPEPGRKYMIHPDNLLTDPLYNTEEGFYGISPTVLLKRWLDLDMAMTQQVTDFFENGAIPSLMVNMKPGTNFTYEQDPQTLMTMMKENWMRDRSGSEGRGRKTPAFTYGDINIERIEERIEETVAKNLYYEIQGRVCATYGVPVTLYEMGMRYGSQRSSAEQHEKDFYNRTICKILARFGSKINQLVVPSFNTPGLEVVWDLSEMGIASFLLESKKLSVKKDWELGLISRDTARALLGYEPIGGELGDDFYRLTVMSDSSSGNPTGATEDNRLKQPKVSGELDTNVANTTLDY